MCTTVLLVFQFLIFLFPQDSSKKRKKSDMPPAVVFFVCGTQQQYTCDVIIIKIARISRIMQGYVF
jgi:hypothetical protein